MPDVRNCRKCGKIFSFIRRSPICPSCKQADEDDFKKVKEYLYDHPGASLNQVSLDLVISVEKIKLFLKEGIKTKFEEVNSFATQIQQLNRQIYITELDGNAANDLRDQRTLFMFES